MYLAEYSLRGSILSAGFLMAGGAALRYSVHCTLAGELLSGTVTLYIGTICEKPEGVS